jgi:hypothetical protein
MNVSVPPHRDGSDAVYSSTLAQLEIVIWDMKREMLRGISKIIDEDYDKLCEKYCPASRLIQSCGTMVVPGIQPIQEALEETVYIQPAAATVAAAAAVAAGATAAAPGRVLSHGSSKKRARARLDRQWNPSLHCHCRRLTGYCYGPVKSIEEGQRMCQYHHNQYVEYKRGNHTKNQWFGFVEDIPKITNTNPIMFRKWRDGKLLKGDTYEYEGTDLYVRLKHHTCYVALYTAPSEGDAPVVGYYNIYTNTFITLPVHLWDVYSQIKLQRDPVIISEGTEYPVYTIEYY